MTRDTKEQRRYRQARMVGDSGFVVPPDCVSLAMLPYSCRRGFEYGRLPDEVVAASSRGVLRVLSAAINPPNHQTPTGRPATSRIHNSTADTIHIGQTSSV